MTPVPAAPAKSISIAAEEMRKNRRVLKNLIDSLFMVVLDYSCCKESRVSTLTPERVSDGR